MKHVFFFAFVVLLIGCTPDATEEANYQNFTTILDNNEFSTAFYPLDVRQTTRGDYLVLAEKKIPETTFRGVYVVLVDESGRFERELSLDETFVNPIGPLMLMGESWYFVCMDPLNQQAKVVSVDELLEGFTSVSAGGITYPGAVAKDGNDFVLLSYDQADKNTIISRHGVDGSFKGSPLALSIGVGEDVEEPIINHYLRTGKRFPFQVGSVPGGGYFLNGFYNYTFSLVFIDGSLQNAQGVVQGQQDDGGFSAILPLSGGKYAASRFNFGDNYLLPNVTLSSTSTTIGLELGGNAFPELVSNANVKILGTSVKNKNVLVFASDTRSKQIGLYFHDEASGAFLTSRYLGFSNPFEVGSLSSTEDGGLIVCGTTYLAGRFPRICLLKLSKGEIERQVP